MTERIQLWHGDSRELLQKIDEPVHCVITDPPYGMKYKSNMATTQAGKSYANEIEADEDLEGAIRLFEEVMGVLIPKMTDDSDLYVFTMWKIVGPWMDAVQSLPGINMNMMLVWNKGDPGMGDLDGWGCGYELILAAKKGRRANPYRRSGILNFDKVRPGKMIHPTEKPVPLLEALVKMSTHRDELIVDPFGGSFSVGMAAKQTGRRAICIEKDKKFYDRAIRRFTETLVMDF
jgi:adenine-specific DNA-methyltransferase